MKYIIDDIDEESIMKIIRSFVIHIYGEELSMEEDEDGYLRFYSVGPIPPYHRNKSGRLWVDDDRLFNLINKFLGADKTETFAFIGFYFSKTYDIVVSNCRFQPHKHIENGVDYAQFDDANYNVEED